MSDRIVIMNHGRVVQVGTPETLYERPATVFAAGFLGKSNFIEEGGVTHALRPEKIDVAPAGEGAVPARLSGRVAGVTYLGSTLMLTVSVPGAPAVEVAADAWRTPHRFAEGDMVDLSWAEGAAVPVEDDEAP